MSLASYIPGSRNEASRTLWERARSLAPRGAQGEGKYYSPFPHFIVRAHGSRIWDADGNEYIDYWNGAGPCVLGHGDQAVGDAVAAAVKAHGLLFCAPHEGEVALSETLADIIPCAEMSAYLNAGSDVLCMAVRTARALTRRPLIVKFAGSYHGWYDGLLFNIASYDGPPDNQGLYRPIAESDGLPDGVADVIRVLDYNDADSVEALLQREGDRIAAIMVEPVMHGPLTGSIAPDPGFLQRLRDLCSAHGCLLVFDEILTGFRHDLGGAQSLLGVTPDLAAFGKAIANGYPLAALCGPTSVMGQLSPSGRAYFSGTYNGNVASVAAAAATIARLRDGSVHRHIGALGERLRAGFDEVFERRGSPARARAFGSLVAIHFTAAPLRCLSDVMRNHDAEQSPGLVSFLYQNGIYTKPRKVLRFAVSNAHSEQEIDRTIDVVDQYFSRQ